MGGTRPPNRKAIRGPPAAAPTKRDAERQRRRSQAPARRPETMTLASPRRRRRGVKPQDGGAAAPQAGSSQRPKRNRVGRDGESDGPNPARAGPSIANRPRSREAPRQYQQQLRPARQPPVTLQRRATGFQLPPRRARHGEGDGRFRNQAPRSQVKESGRQRGRRGEDGRRGWGGRGSRNPGTLFWNARRHGKEEDRKVQAEAAKASNGRERGSKRPSAPAS